MTPPPHSASYKPHFYVIQELVEMDYLASAYDRFPCDLAGARTSRFRWINVGVRQSDDGAVVLRPCIAQKYWAVSGLGREGVLVRLTWR